MPWSHTSPMDPKTQFIADDLRHHISVTELWRALRRQPQDRLQLDRPLSHPRPTRLRRAVLSAQHVPSPHACPCGGGDPRCTPPPSSVGRQKALVDPQSTLSPGPGRPARPSATSSAATVWCPRSPGAASSGILANPRATLVPHTLHALVFVYRYVLWRSRSDLGEIARAKRLPGSILDVLTREEVARRLAHLTDTAHLMAGLLYGAGLRLMECVRLRIRDLRFRLSSSYCPRWQGGAGSRHHPAPSIAAGAPNDSSSQPGARTKPTAGGIWRRVSAVRLGEQRPECSDSLGVAVRLFPASKRSLAPRSGIERLHHISETVPSSSLHPPPRTRRRRPFPRPVVPGPCGAG